jgi:hypothetical protein
MAVTTGVVAALLLILKQNSKLKSDKKLHDIEVKDTELKTQQESIQTEKQKIKEDLKSIEVIKDMSEDDIESFWKDRKK